MKNTISGAIAIALLLGAIAAPAQARYEQDGEYEFSSWGACGSYLNRMRRTAAKETDLSAVSRWDAAYCHAVAWKHIVIIFPV